MPLHPKTRRDEPPYPRRRPRRLGAALCGVIVASALGCTTVGRTPTPAAPAPRVVASAPMPPPAAAPEPSRAPEPDWQLEDGVLALQSPPAPEVALGDRPRPAAVVIPAHGARIMGSISREVVREGVRAGLEDFRACWQGLEGQGLDEPVGVAARFTIAGDGTVREAEVRADAPGAESLSECLVEVFEGLRFPPLPGGGVVVVSYPLRFVASGSTS